MTTQDPFGISDITIEDLDRIPADGTVLIYGLSTVAVRRSYTLVPVTANVERMVESDEPKWFITHKEGVQSLDTSELLGLVKRLRGDLPIRLLYVGYLDDVDDFLESDE